ncbi:MAG: selenium-dependent xanthine dehydrogenase [Deltaproteobacteria bacterium]|nr:MAG: selenium-dependent xanthine dehydrogenase [Deltaproteobacteria bacterium]
MDTLRFTINGQEVEVAQEEGLTALAAIRDRLGITSPKDGCSPQGQCGCCTVQINGKALMCCTKSAESLADKEVTTLEGLSHHHREVLARAFVKTGGLQCGFCIPGISMRVATLLNRTDTPNDKQIRNAMQPHLCRCTGYVKIFDAIREAALHWNTETLPELPTESHVGAGTVRYLGQECVLGEKAYVDDMVLPDMLHGAVLLSEHPKARVVSIDTSAAESAPGVHAVITAKDLPGAKKVGLIEKDWSVLIDVGEVTHCMGSVIAAVAAETREQARAATALIEVEYQVLTPVTGPKEALATGAPEVHPGQPNLLRTCMIKRGDVDAAIQASEYVLEEVFSSQRIEHAFLEPEAALAVPEENGVLLYTQGQGVHDDQRQVAAILDLPLENVRVKLVSNGGAFGGKEDLSIQGHTALLAQHTQRPVKLVLSRDQSMRMHPKRHPIEMHYTVGCDAQGKLTVVKARMYGDTGAYASVGDKVLERAAGHSCSAYRVPVVDVEAYTVYTNNPPSGAFRGFGVNQTAFAMEGMLDRLAELAGVDRYDIRERNILHPGDRFATGQIMNESVGLQACLEAVKDDFKNATYAGIACGIKNTGIGNGMPDIGRALLSIGEDGHVTLFTGYTEMGQGLFTVLQQVVCEEAGLTPDQISVKVNTDYAVECGMTTASRATVLAGEATRRASLKLKEALDSGKTLWDLKDQSFHGEFICDFTTKPGTNVDNPVTHLTFGYATQVVILNEDGTLQKVIAAHDVGKVMNRLQCEGQIEGSVHMGLGYALTEDMRTEGGVLESTNINDMCIIRARHIPEIEVRLLEVPDPIGPYGAKGVGEIGLVPTAAAVAGALHAYDGLRRKKLPMRGSPAARAILPKSKHEPDPSA